MTDEIKKEQPLKIELPVSNLGKCSDCKHYCKMTEANGGMPNPYKITAYCTNKDNRGKHVSALSTCAKQVRMLEPITFAPAQNAFDAEIQNLLEFIATKGTPITGIEYGRECFETEGETE